ncbi:MAG: NAD(P)-dependent oxidoreductase [Cyanobium sp. LacPavin_0920_WC12_MAG_63_22]|nr:NAD(P)-dependent oxidoreductase [Cyanobium sp. LacPavin_0920_WC12_MAG_63_22]
MRIALTGGTGFIGSHFLNQALGEGNTVVALRRSVTSIPRIPLAKQPEWIDCQLDEVSADELRGCEVLVHLAAHSVQYPFDSIANCLRWNLTAVMALFEQARLAGIRRFVVAGSCFEYGRSGERYNFIPTYAPLEPTNSYAASKAAASIALSQWAEEHQLSLDILRVFHVFGEGEAEDRFWPSLRRAALAGDDFPMTAGEQVRDFIPVQDAASAFLWRASLPYEPTTQSNVFNLSSGCVLSMQTFASSCWQKWNAGGKLNIGHLQYRKNEIMRYVAGPTSITVRGSSFHVDKSS